MRDREILIKSFLQGTGWGEASRAPLAGDASSRRYERLTLSDGKAAVLMDAPPDQNDSLRAFIKIARFLTANGMSAPDIYAVDEPNGFLLLEDLGDALFARVLDYDPGLEHRLYTAGVDALVALHRVQPPSDLPVYTAPVLAEKTLITWQWYPGAPDQPYLKKACAFQQRFETILAETGAKSDVLIQRDYHAENLIWLPDRAGLARVGMLDFQDALIGHRAYDLVSLLQDARRDVSTNLETQMIDHYIKETGVEPDAFRASYHLLGLQRNLRIIGIFARLSLHFGKAHYIDFIPRVWGYIERDLSHPSAKDIKDLILRDLPAPSPDHLQRLRDLCGTVPTP